MDSEGNDQRLIREITLRNLLSFGPDTPALELQNLNILIGPNASGKSNFIEAIALLRSTPVAGSSDSSFSGILRRGGGPEEWLWKGSDLKIAAITVVVSYFGGIGPLSHFLEFGRSGLGRERIDGAESSAGHAEPHSYYESDFFPGTSVLATLRGPEHEEITFLFDAYDGIRIYREWGFGRNSVFRAPQRADMRNDRLEEDFSNLGLILSRLPKKPRAKAAVLDALRDLYEGVTDFYVVAEGGTVQVFFTEGNITVPAVRLSDGTLRYLCLLAILCDPDPPPLICIEEPELGLHPDILPKLADLLWEASQRTQLIVTTHSDVLVDAMTEHPEAIIVCEKHEHKTTMQRLKKEELAVWLEKYRLGQLWLRGEIGGTRW